MKLNKIAKILVISSSTAFAANAFAIDELEINDSAGEAQQLTSVSYTTVEAEMGFSKENINKDVDFYQFTGIGGDLLTINIDNGYKVDAPLHTRLVVYGPAPEYKYLGSSNRALSDDSGSISTNDARIDKFTVPADGVYTVGVTRYPNYITSAADGTITKSIYSTDNEVITTYDLVISGASTSTADPTQINIEIKPGNENLTVLNPRSKGKIPVAILGSSSFSAINVDTSSLTFGSTGDELSLSKCAKSGEDVNGDGHYDLVCHFENQLAHFKSDDSEGVLKGETRTGEAFEGHAPLKVIPGRK